MLLSVVQLSQASPASPALSPFALVMKTSAARAFAFAALATPSLALQLKPSTGGQQYVDNKFIVELESGSSLSSRSADTDIHARFLADLERRLPSNAYKVQQTYSSDIFNGATVGINNVNDLKKIAAASGVKSVHPVRILEAPQVVTHSTAGVDKVHAAGNKGQGIKIGIIDTGVDYTHPALGGGFGPGFKVAGGYDFVGDNYNAAGSPAVPDPDPLDQCAGHGTHVAGIIGANPANEYNVTGVAYKASLRAYRVFGCTGGTEDSIVMAALLRAYSDGNDVINLSLGGINGWTSDPLSVVASRIAAKGRVVAVAAGNEGEFGAFYGSTPAAGKDVIAVASVDNIGLGPLFTITTTIPGVGPIPYRWGTDFKPIDGANVKLPVYATSRDSSITDDACNPLPANTPNLAGYATLVRRGSCAFETKALNVAAAGGKYVIVYNNDGEFITPDFGSYQYGVLIRDSDGLVLLDAFLKGTSFTVSFPNTGTVSIANSQTGGLASSFSSVGPSFDMYFKPAIAAPGGGILSTWPTTKGSYAILDGTSMATPHLAGISALILKAKGRGVAKNMRTILQTTSALIPQTLANNSLPQSLAKSGSGLANAFAAFSYRTTVSPGELLLNDTAHWVKQHTIKIVNTSKKKRTYTLKHVPAGTMMPFQSGSIQPVPGPVPLVNAPARVKLSSTRVTIAAGKSVSVKVTINPPAGVEAARVPIISGHIQVATAGETLRVSYLGAAQDLRKIQVTDNTPDVLGVATPVVADPTGNVQTGPRDYTFVNGDNPTVYFRDVFGSARIAFDLVKEDFQLPQQPKKRAGNTADEDWLVGAVGAMKPAHKSIQPGTYAKVPILGHIAEFRYFRRHNNGNDLYSGFGVANVYANGTAIAPGRYRLLGRFLKVGGEPTIQAWYESWISPVIGVVAP
ncbi:subtilisin-like protein [Auriculariales sp. MPI-PUGE-AT-0066]|nr:subtilisin-like protein [Auriculariales sp. MPI-PUGE-AT-0066]